MAFYDSSARYDAGLHYDEAVPITPGKKPMTKIKLNLARLSIADLLLRAADIKTKMTGNANFTTPIPPLTELTTQITALTTSNNAYNQGELTQKQNKTARDNDAETLRALLSQLASYVEAASGGDAAKILSAGMDTKSVAAPIGVPEMVASLALTASDNEGELDAQWDPVRGAKSYEMEISADPITASSWVMRPSVPKSLAKLTGLTSGSKVWVRVRAMGAAGPGAWSDPATKIVP